MRTTSPYGSDRRRARASALGAAVRALGAAVRALGAAGSSFPVAAILIALCVLPTACGIPQLPILEPPQLGTVTQLPAEVTFRHDPLNNTDNFRGYELYYKFYDPATAGAGGVEAQIRADATAIEDAAPSNIPNAALARGFRRVFTGQLSDSPPALPVAAGLRGTTFEVTVTFPNSATAEEAVASWAGNDQVLLRDQNALGNPSETLGFGAPDLTPGTHIDLPSSVESPQLDMALMVVSFGVDFATGTFSNIYSGAIVTEQPLFVIHE